jgi:hypothetical protein
LQLGSARGGDVNEILLDVDSTSSESSDNETPLKQLAQQRLEERKRLKQLKKEEKKKQKDVKKFFEKRFVGFFNNYF